MLQRLGGVARGLPQKLGVLEGPGGVGGRLEEEVLDEVRAKLPQIRILDPLPPKP